jgi:hypothetical protein
MSYLCQWQLPNIRIFNKWIPRNLLLPWYKPKIVNNNIISLIQYYIKKQHLYYTNFINTHFILEQPKDIRYISFLLILPLIHLQIE